MNPSLIIGENDMGPPAVVNQLKEIDIDLRTIPEDQRLRPTPNNLVRWPSDSVRDLVCKHSYRIQTER